MPLCPTCRRSYSEGTAACPEDNSELVDSMPFQTVEGPDHSTWIEIVSPVDEEEARLLKGFLEAEGIPAEVESLKFHMEPVNVGSLAEIRLYVRAEDETRAIELLRRQEEKYVRLDEEELSSDDGSAAIDDDVESAEKEEPV